LNAGDGGIKLSIVMAAQEPESLICPGCGAHNAADLRYCVNCYRPITGKKETIAHIESARAVATTHRDDPTIVFLPEEHEAIIRRARRRKRLIIAGLIALVMAIAGAFVFNTLNRKWQEEKRAMARHEAARADLTKLADALERFRTDVGRYPTNPEGLRGLTHKPAAFMASDAAQMNKWYGPYLESVPEVDPWGNDYIYQTADGGQSFELFSYGPGGETGSGSYLYVTSPTQLPDAP
jgi:general secretion pathway protein G